MNYIVVTKTLLLFGVFSAVGLIAGLTADDFDKNTPTEESYLKSYYYQETKKSYAEAMIEYDSNNNYMKLFSSMMPILALLVSGSYYFLNYRYAQQTSKSVKGNES